MTFTNDLSFGNQYEKKYATYKGFKNYIIKEGKFKPYDIRDLDTNIKYEVKTDRYTHRTGNMCIEFMCNNQPSGISTTEAEWYAYWVYQPDGKDELYEIPVAELKDMIKQKKYLREQNGGDGFRSKFYLIKKELFNIYKIAI
jgi:hypothetical protein